MTEFSLHMEKLGDWDTIYSRYCALAGSGALWAFRGQENGRWQLRTTLERVIVRFALAGRSFPDQCDPDYSTKEDKIYREVLASLIEGIRPGLQTQLKVFEIEGGLLRMFKRQCHIYASDIPADDNTMEWLALLRHYGGATRLLDFTYSFFVALFFALENAEGEGVVWALNTDWLDSRIRALVPEKMAILDNDPHVRKESFRKIFANKPELAIYAINPYRRNERLAIQQGVFLCPGKIDVPFVDNLVAILATPDSKSNFFKFQVGANSSQRIEILRHLRRMNISRATLFPDLEGFAQSLTTSVIFPDSLVPDQDWMAD